MVVGYTLLGIMQEMGAEWLERLSDSTGQLTVGIHKNTIAAAGAAVKTNPETAGSGRFPIRYEP